MFFLAWIGLIVFSFFLNELIKGFDIHAVMREFGSTLKPVRRLKFRGTYRARSRWFHPSELPWVWQNESRKR